MTQQDQAVQNDKMITPHKVSADQVRECFASSMQHSLQLAEVDVDYLALTEADWQKVLKFTTVAWKVYKPEYFDCDDFAVCQKALISLHFNINGCGWVLDSSGEHSYNVILVCDAAGDRLHTRIVEPQQDAEVPYKMVGTAHYAERSGLIII